MCEGRRLKGGDVHLDYPSVGATENLMMAAAMAPGSTVIRNAAREPEIIELQNVINHMGGEVRGAGTSNITIEGKSKLNGFEYTCMPDRIAAGTFMVAAVVTRGKITLRNVIPEHLYAISAKLREAGADIKVYEDAMTVSCRERPRKCTSSRRARIRGSRPICRRRCARLRVSPEARASLWKACSITALNMCRSCCAWAQTL